jgi:hypothetical protein
MLTTGKWFVARLVEILFVIALFAVWVAFLEDDPSSENALLRLVDGAKGGGQFALIYNVFYLYLPLSAAATFILAKIYTSNGRLLAFSNSVIYALHGWVVFLLLGLVPFSGGREAGFFDWAWIAVIAFNLAAGFLIYRRVT